MAKAVCYLVCQGGYTNSISSDWFLQGREEVWSVLCYCYLPLVQQKADLGLISEWIYQYWWKM